jgi:hypothetical protein
LPRAIGAKNCPICGAGLKGRQRSACSDRCRAAKSRWRRTEDLGGELQAAADTLSRVADQLRRLCRTASGTEAAIQKRQKS